MIIIACLKPLYGIRVPNDTRIFIRSWEQDLKPYVDQLTGEYFEPFLIPCGKCINCRLDYARNWANRCLLESMEWKDNWFITLTYDDSKGGLTYGEGDLLTLVPKHFTDFMKRLRAHFSERGHDGVRFYMCGEYGDRTLRPHYHALVFNLPLDDLKEYSRSSLGDTYYNSPTLDKLWGFGYVVIGELTVQSASYVARYVQKKAGKSVLDYAAEGITPEYVRMSRRPGIAANYFQDNFDKIYQDDKLYLPGGKIQGVPRYCDTLAEREGVDLTAIKAQRSERAKLVNEYTRQQVSQDWYRYHLDLEESVMKKSKSLKRYL